MRQLESKGAVVARRLASQSPELFEFPQPIFSWEMVTFDEARIARDVDWDDLSTHKTLTCVNHPKSRYSTKNPWSRSVFCHKGANGGDAMFDEECNCPFSDMRVVIR